MRGNKAISINGADQTDDVQADLDIWYSHTVNAGFLVSRLILLFELPIK